MLHPEESQHGEKVQPMGFPRWPFYRIPTYSWPLLRRTSIKAINTQCLGPSRISVAILVGHIGAEWRKRLTIRSLPAGAQHIGRLDFCSIHVN